MVAPPMDGKFTYRDYLTWPDDKRWEIIDGEAYAMTPAPRTDHQAISMALSGVLWNALVGKPCRLFAAPCDVVLSDFDVVEPDLLVVCDPSKITERCIAGAPDLVVEILSPSTTVRDLRDKRRLYERTGVREYLIIDPVGLVAHRYVLGENGRYGSNEVFGAQDEMPLTTLPGVVLPMWTVFGVEKKEEKRETPRTPNGTAREAG